MAKDFFLIVPTLLTHVKKVSSPNGLAITSLVFALVGFSYNVWRLELSEANTTVRTACFQMIMELAALEQIIYSKVYDNNTREGSPRKAWVKVGVIIELSHFTSNDIQQSSQQLHQIWSQQANRIESPKTAVPAASKVIQQLDAVRADIRSLVQTLK